MLQTARWEREVMNLDTSQSEIIEINGELVLILRLGRRASGPIPTLERVKRAFQIKPPAQDIVGPFLAVETVIAPGARCRAMPLYVRYQEWCVRAGQERLSRAGFHRAIKAQDFKQIRSNGH